MSLGHFSEHHIVWCWILAPGQFSVTSATWLPHVLCGCCCTGTAYNPSSYILVWLLWVQVKYSFVHHNTQKMWNSEPRSLCSFFSFVVCFLKCLPCINLLQIWYLELYLFAPSPKIKNEITVLLTDFKIQGFIKKRLQNLALLQCMRKHFYHW